MVNEEILGGLRNALERGQTLDKAVQSFINAGYNSNDVKAAASKINQGASTMMQPSQPKEQKPEEKPSPTKPSVPQQKETPKTQPSPQPQTEQTPKPKTSLWKKIKHFISPVKMETRNLILIAVIVILLLVIGGLALLTIFSEQLLQAIA